MAIDDLIANLKSPDAVTRVRAAALLAEMDEEAASVVPVLISMLISDSVQDRKLAIWTLGEIGPVAEAAVPSLLDIAQDEDEDEAVIDLTVTALEKIDLVEERKAA